MPIIDLSLPITNAMPGVEISDAKLLEMDGWNASTLKLYSHCGTHIDAPRHFVSNGHTLDEHDLNKLVGPARVINLAPASPRQLLSVDDMAPHASYIVPGSRLLLRTDWYKRYGTPAYRHELPRISLELAQWLVAREVALVGVEPPSVADVNNLQELTEVHQALFRGQVVIVEGLAYLDQLTTDLVEFIALPLKVMGGDGSPVRAVARELE
jgi:arylformamidase